MFIIHMGIPEMEALWNEWSQQDKAKTLKGENKKLFDKWVKAMKLLRENPNHPSLMSHTIDILTQKYGFTILESYLENKTNGRPWRMFWTYGPYQGAITILGLEPHPRNSRAYKRINLSHKP